MTRLDVEAAREHLKAAHATLDRLAGPALAAAVVCYIDERLRMHEAERDTPAGPSPAQPAAREVDDLMLKHGLLGMRLRDDLCALAAREYQRGWDVGHRHLLARQTERQRAAVALADKLLSAVPPVVDEHSTWMGTPIGTELVAYRRAARGARP
jgi:hypothetical protein